MDARAAAILLIAFLLGSIPTAYVVARLTAGVDIRAVGDGNVGARNTFLSVGPLAGITVGVVDIGKGAVAVALARSLGAPDWVVRAAGVCVALGHDFTPFLRFHGGQGMAAILGVFGVLYPAEIGAALVIAALTFAITRHWDLSCAVGFVLFAASLWLTDRTTGEALYPFFVLPTIGLSKLVQVWQARRATGGLARG